MHTALSATCDMVAVTDEDVQLVMDLQDEAHTLVADVVARHLHRVGAARVCRHTTG